MIERIQDGHGQLLGMDASVHGAYLSDTLVSKAVNRTFRGGQNQVRPRFKGVKLFFEDSLGREDDELRQLFEYGNIQGAFGYTKTSQYRDAGLVVAVAGHLLFGKIVANSIRFTEIYDRLDATVLDTWFTQGQEQLFVQNGVSNPVFWDGNESAKEIFGINKMPVGTLLAYNHGRVAVSNAENVIAVSDHILGAGAGVRDNMTNFEENVTWLGGTFSTPSNLGQITAMVPLPVSGNRTGQGDLVLLCENGAASLDLAPFRNEWRDASLVMVGAGGVSPYAAVPVNNDIWYRRPDGVGSLRQARVDETREWVDTPMSKEVDNWLGHESPHLMRHVSACYFDNRLFVTVGGRREVSEQGYGTHRFFNGMVVLDFDRGSTVSKQAGFAWDGLWTGPRPTQITTVFTEGVNRMFTLSFDKDGKNRIYEMGRDQGHDPGGKPIESFYVTKKFHSFREKSDVFTRKELLGGGRIHVTSQGRGSIEIDTRPDDYPCWNEYMPETPIGWDNCDPECPQPVMSKPYHATLKSTTPDTTSCQEGSGQVVGSGYTHQFLVKMTGAVNVPWMSVEAKNAPEANRNDTCGAPFNDEKNKDPISCCTEKDFDYTIVSG